MCGISGIIGTFSPDKLQKMLQIISYRGPDETTVFSDNLCSIGLNRLKIKGNTTNKIQFNIFGRKVVVALNGEIYNYQSLRDHYSKNANYCFETDLELELLALMYVVDGELFINKVDGMFSIAIYDSRKLILYRDRVGIKPFYYTVNNRGMIFSSEIKAIVIVDENFHDINMSTLMEQLLLSFGISENETILKDIHQLSPGSYLKFENDSYFVKKYYNFTPIEVSADIEENIAITENLLDQAAIKCFKHDNLSKGLFLSGGIDSALLALKAHQLSFPFSAYTLSPDNNDDFEDALHAKELSKKLNINHHVMHVNKELAINSLIKFTYFYENIDFAGIFSPYGGLAFYLISKEISTFHRVAISGDGADELFAGYQSLHSNSQNVFNDIYNRANKIADRSGYKEHILNTLRRRFFSTDSPLVLYDLLLDSGLNNYHLPCLDKCTSCFSMELRPIYLDINLYEHARNIGLSQNMHDGMNKYILQKLSKKSLGQVGINMVSKRKKLAMPSALDGVIGHINQKLKDIYGISNQPRNKFSDLFLTIEQRIMFDLFYYIFVYKKCNINVDEVTLSEIIRSKEFSKMYN
jgi:asparagine synthase (glutamine-hydrolysing)